MTTRTIGRAVSVAAATAVLSASMLAAPAPLHAATTFTFANPFLGPIGLIQIPASGPTETTFTGLGPDGAMVQIVTISAYDGARETRCETKVSGTTWSCPFTLGTFTGQLRAELLDENGTAVNGVGYSTVSLPPPALDPASQEILTTTGIGTLTGTTEPTTSTITATVTVSISGDAVCTIPVAADGSWSCDYAIDPLPDGTYPFEVSQERDWSGFVVTSLARASSITLDRVGPAVPGSFTTPSTGTLRVTTASYALAGTAEPSARVRVLADGAPVCGPVIADSTGRWSCTATQPTVDGTYTLSIEQTDAAGNAATVASPTVTVEIRRGIVVIPPPTNTIPNPAPQGGTVTFIDPSLLAVDPSDLRVMTDPLAGTGSTRTIIRELVVNSMQTFLTGVDGLAFGDPVRVEIPFDLSMIYPPDLGGDTSILPNNWDDLPRNYYAAIYIFSEPRQLDREQITGDGLVTLSGRIPDDIGEGEHELVVIVEAEGGEPVEALEVRLPVTVTAPEVLTPDTDEADSAAWADTGAWWWMVLAVAVAGAGILAAVIVMARGARRRA